MLSQNLLDLYPQHWVSRRCHIAGLGQETRDAVIESALPARRKKSSAEIELDCQERDDQNKEGDSFHAG